MLHALLLAAALPATADPAAPPSALVPEAAALAAPWPWTPPAGPRFDVASRPGRAAAEFGGRLGLFVTGLSLIGVGLLAGGAGWIVLATCTKRAGSTDFGDCADDTVEIVGWVLAAPGILPLAVGGLLVYISFPNSSHAALPAEGARRFASGRGAPWGLTLGVAF